MSTRKIKVKAKAEKIREILDALDLIRFGEVTFDVDVQDNERVQGALNNFDGIIDYSVVVDYGDEISDEINTLIPESENIEYVKDFNSLATYIEAFWKAARLGKSIESIYDNIASSPLSIDHVALKAILESYYSDDFEKAIADSKKKLNDNKNIISEQLSLTGVAMLLYKK